jgi:hypothetical protein
MPVLTEVVNLNEALAARSFPTVTLWNRLEGRPRRDDFSRALKAEVRDALWMLTRQWQLGEFQGDDAGSPIFTKVHVTRATLKKYRARGQAAEPFEDDVPLEAKVERRPIAFTLAGAEVSLDLRLLMGRHWLKLMRTIPGDFASDFITQYPVHAPDPTQAADAPYCAHPEVWSGFAAASGRRMDGAKLFQHLSDPTHHASDGIAGLAGREAEIDALAQKFVAFFERLFYQPAKADAWAPDRLEYQFSCSAPEVTGEKVLSAEEYYHGELDWYNLDVEPRAASPNESEPPDSELPAPDTQTLIPTQLSFPGMPNSRWWAFEEGRTNFGEVKPDTTDLAKLLLIEFGLVFSNDWFLIPYPLPAGSIARIRGMAVTNVFGERTWIEAAGRGPDDAWQRWAMFNLNLKGQGNESADTSILLLPTVAKTQAGNPREEILLIRDEVANMVWGVEKTIPLPSGASKAGSEAATETLAFYKQGLTRRLAGAPVAEPDEFKANIRYRVMTSVPEYWIPFLPVHVPGDNREIQLQRGALPRVLEGDPDPARKVRPRTGLLREGLESETKAPYFLHEEEVPRAGVRLTQTFQRTRWRDGRVWLWLGIRKQPGRGEGSSGLAFDQIEDVKPSG